jgi:hypothetical protein
MSMEKKGASMSDQNNSSENENGQIDPFSDDVTNTISELIERLTAVHHAIAQLGHPTDEEDAALQEKVTGLVSRYWLPENDRHPTIIQSAETAAREIKSLERARASMGTTYGPSATKMMSKLVLLSSEQLGDSIDKLRDHTRRITAMSNPSEVVDEAIENADEESKKRIARFTAVIGLAGTMIDAGNQYLDLNIARNAALELYANGSRPKGWSQRLPEPLKSIMSDGGWKILEEVAKKLGEEGIWHLTSPIPFDDLLVLPARVAWEIKKERVQEQRAYRRGDVDEMLDLSDQLAKATHEVEQLQASVSQIAQAAPR